MKRFAAGVLGAVGIGAWLRRRRKATPPPVEPESPLADELRAKLAESRAAEAAAEPVPEEPAEPELDARRREVHERARGSIDELGS